MFHLAPFLAQKSTNAQKATQSTLINKNEGLLKTQIKRMLNLTQGQLVNPAGQNWSIQDLP